MAVTLTMADMTSGGSLDATRAEPATTSPRADQPRRRVFTAAYKLKIIAEYEALSGHGARAALLRREGLYDSNLRKWIAARDAHRLGAHGNPASAAPASRGDAGEESVEIRRLKAENARLAAELARTKAVLDVVGKTHALFEILSESADKPAPPK